MAYWNRDRAKGQPFVCYCDDCAKAGAVPFSVDLFGDGKIMHQDRPWCWAPWAMGEPCHKCGKGE